MSQFYRSLLNDAETFVATLVVCCVIGWLVGASHVVDAEPPPTLDRALVERLVRAQEAQAEALKVIARNGEKCR